MPSGPMGFPDGAGDHEDASAGDSQALIHRQR
jgi:hypothetical protein